MKKNTFPLRLKTLLEQKQLTLKEVANAINLSIPSVHRWTRGGEIEYENLRALANFLEVNWIWLRYGDEAIASLQESVPANDSVAVERRKYLAEIMENEARMNLAQDMARIVTWEWSVLTDELTASSNSEQIFGQNIEGVRSNLLPFEKLNIEALVAKFTSSELAQEWDFHLPAANSKDECWFVSRGRLLFDAQERPLKMIGVSIDITQRKHMREALEKSEYVMRKVIETIPVGLWIADQNGRIAMANPEAERIWGGTKLVELEQYGEYKGWWEGTGKAIGSEGWTLARAVKHGEVSHGEIVNIEAFDGEQRTIIMSAIPLLDEHNLIIGAIEVNQDITTLKNIEKSLKSIVDQWDFIFKQPLIGIAYCKTSSGHLHVNAKFAELVKCSIAELSNQRIEDLLDEPSLQDFQTKLKESQESASANFMLQGKLKSNSAETTHVQLMIIYNRMPDSTFNTFVFATTNLN
ncbi:MAG: PAS domain-containing protein [Pseudomonadota bacterium]